MLAMAVLVAGAFASLFLAIGRRRRGHARTLPGIQLSHKKPEARKVAAARVPATQVRRVRTIPKTALPVRAGANGDGAAGAVDPTFERSVRNLEVLNKIF
jgi:hypothetical protein